ncbi:MAG: hypothetical protein IPO29_19105 [Anaerolineae bacterium]|nr:hypothetical protein [Anaerolineae bacterium]
MTPTLALPLATVTLVRPTPTPSATEAPTPIPTPAITQDRLNCQHNGDLLTCADDKLGLGSPTRHAGARSESALFLADAAVSYSYEFGVPGAPSGVGKALTTANGQKVVSFEVFRTVDKTGIHAIDGCKLFLDATTCDYVRKDVVIVTRLPNVDALCNPYADTLFLPEMVIAITLPLDRQLPGVQFWSGFLSDNARDSLFESMGGFPIDQKKCNDSASRKAFDQAAQKLAIAIKAGSIDEETDFKIGETRAFAKSIVSRIP